MATNCEYVNVKDYGAIGDGISNDTDACQAAITAGAGKVVYFPKGLYKLSRSLVVGSAIRLMGETRETSKLLAGADIHLLELRMCYDTFIEHLGFSDNQRDRKQISKAAIYINNIVGDSQRIFLRNLLFDQTWQGISNANSAMHNTFGVRISDVLAATRNSALLMFFTTNVYVENFEADHAAGMPPGTHTPLRDIWFYGNSKLGGGLVLNKVISRGAGSFGIVIEGPNNAGTGYGPRFLQAWCWHISADVCGLTSRSAGLLLDHVEQVFVEGSYFSLNTADNVRVRGNTLDVAFIDCQFMAAQQNSHGFLVEGLSGFFPEGVRVQSCLAADNTGDGFKFNGAQRFTLANSIARKNQGYGCFTLGAGSGYLIQCNNFYSNTLGNLNDRASGANASVTGNLTS
jgi:Pectate lyase superfamily protein